MAERMGRGMTTFLDILLVLILWGIASFISFAIHWSTWAEDATYKKPWTVVVAIKLSTTILWPFGVLYGVFILMKWMFTK